MSQLACVILRRAAAVDAAGWHAPDAAIWGCTTSTSLVMHRRSRCMMAGCERAPVACLLVVTALALLSGAAATAVHRGFIRQQDGQFIDQECREFNFVGANACVPRLQTVSVAACDLAASRQACQPV